jgi:hypothetical protein
MKCVVALLQAGAHLGDLLVAKVRFAFRGSPDCRGSATLERLIDGHKNNDR